MSHFALSAPIHINSCFLWKIYTTSMFGLEDLKAIFSGQEDFAWLILHSEIMLQSASTLQTSQVKTLIELYSIGMERLNQLQYTPANYFKNKINELMGQKRVIRCLHSHKENELSRHKQNKEEELLNRRREMETRLAYDIQSTTENLRSIINEETARQSAMQRMVRCALTSEEMKLQSKIKQRHHRISSKTARQQSLLPQEVAQQPKHKAGVSPNGQ